MRMLRLSRAVRLACVSAIAWLALLALAGAASALPDGWGYELISPADTAGNDVVTAVASSDGVHAWVKTGAPLTGDQTTGNFTTFLATRTSTAWTLQDLADPTRPGDTSAGLLAFTEDGAHEIISECQQVLLSCNPGTETWYSAQPDRSRTPLFAIPASTPTPGLVHLTPDGSRFYVQVDSGGTLLPEDTHTQGAGVYDYHDGQLHFIGIDASGTPFPCGAVIGAGRPTGGFGTGFEQDGVSADGNTVVLESPDPDSGCPDPVDVYLRRAGSLIDVSAPQNGNPDLGASYVGSSADGDTLYFTTTSQLVAQDTDNLRDLYVYHAQTATLERITPGSDVFLNPGVAVSPHGDYVYFDAPHPINGQGVDGEQNLFVYHAGQIKLIRTTNQGFFFLGGSMFSQTPSAITPDGTHLLFMSTAPLTGAPSGGFLQAFQYDVSTGQLACVSCTTDGSLPIGDTRWSAAEVNARFQSDDGHTVMFQTKTSLLPEDVNGRQDVYLWQNGQLSLISSGRGLSDSLTVNMSADGKTVFFLTKDDLGPSMGFGGTKLYAARPDPFPPASRTPAPCSDQDCQGPPSAAPGMPSIASSTVTTAGGAPSLVSASPPARAATNAQQLSRALRVCRRIHHHTRRRRRCEAQARHRYARGSAHAPGASR